MTLGYDLERVRVLCAALIDACATFAKHENIPDWLAHRVCHLSCEAQGFALDTQMLENMNEYAKESP